MYIAVDIGGSNTRVAGSLSLESPRFVSDPIRRRNTHSYSDDLEFIRNSARSIAGESGIVGLGIGIPGAMNASETKLLSARNMQHWIKKPFVQTLTEDLKCEVFVENDGVAAGLGEAFYDKTPEQFEYVIWGTGIGGSKIQRNSHKSHAYVTKLNHKLYFKAWEDECGGRELEQRFSKPTTEFTDEQWEGILKTFSQQLTRFIELTNARAIVLGGGLAIRHRDSIETFSTENTAVNVTPFDDDGGLYGAFGVIRNARSGHAVKH